MSSCSVVNVIVVGIGWSRKENGSRRLTSVPCCHINERRHHDAQGYIMSFRYTTAVALAMALSAPAFAQDTLTSTSGSNSDAVSGSQSGAASNSNQGQQQGQTANNAGIGNSTSASGSSSNANASTSSGASSNGNQQGQSANNAQGQDQGQGQTQGQSANNSQTNMQGQQASNQQGVTVNQQWNSTNRKTTEVRTNAAVPLAASSSFSSDYCGGTASGGASVAPLGVSIGGAGPTFDKSCQYLRVAEKAGMLGANYNNMGQRDASLKAMSLMSWAVCMAGPTSKAGRSPTTDACLALGLMGSDVSPASPANEQPAPAYAPEPAVMDNSGHPTPEAILKAGERGSATIPAHAVDPTVANTNIAASSYPERP